MKRAIIATILIAGIIGFVAWNNRGANHDAPDRISYNFHIRPILSDKCFACHGPDKNKLQAGLRLDLAESAYAPLPETPGAFAIVPGKPEASELMKRITSKDPDYQMPTPESHLSLLTEQEIELVKKWIEQGAVYEKHWAFLPPKKAPLPKVNDPDWVKNEIDHFTLAKMTEKGLEPNETATPEYLLKRIEEENIKGVVFLTGDRHHTEMDQYTNGAGNLVTDITISPLTSGHAFNVTEDNKYHIEGTLVTKRNFAILEFSGPRTSRVLTVKTYDSNGEELWVQTIKPN